MVKTIGAAAIWFYQIQSTQLKFGDDSPSRTQKDLTYGLKISLVLNRAIWKEGNKRPSGDESKNIHRICDDIIRKADRQGTVWCRRSFHRQRFISTCILISLDSLLPLHDRFPSFFELALSQLHLCIQPSLFNYLKILYPSKRCAKRHSSHDIAKRCNHGGCKLSGIHHRRRVVAGKKTTRARKKLRLFQERNEGNES